MCFTRADGYSTNTTLDAVLDDDTLVKTHEQRANHRGARRPARDHP